MKKKLLKCYIIYSEEIKFEHLAILQVLPLRDHGGVENCHRRCMSTVRDII